MDELIHQIKHAAQQQAQEHRPFLYAHIASYDPKLHRVRCVVPSLRDEGDNPVVTSWMPLASAWVGQGWGLQIAPKGGATQKNPTAGEPVVIQLVERSRGVAAVASMFFNQVNLAPFNDLQPGEFGAKHESGSLLKFTKDGDVQVSASRDLLLSAVRDVTITAGRNLSAGAASGMATWQGAHIVLHGTVSAAFDADGVGFLYKVSSIDNYTTGVPVTPHAPDPPQIPSQ